MEARADEGAADADHFLLHCCRAGKIEIGIARIIRTTAVAGVAVHPEDAGMAGRDGRALVDRNGLRASRYVCEDQQQ
jgi:hypothetical protein